MVPRIEDEEIVNECTTYRTPIMIILAPPRLDRVLIVTVIVWKRVRCISTLYPHFTPGVDLVPFPVTIIKKRSACRLYQESHHLPTDCHPSYHGRVRRVSSFI